MPLSLSKGGYADYVSNLRTVSFLLSEASKFVSNAHAEERPEGIPLVGQLRETVRQVVAFEQEKLDRLLKGENFQNVKPFWKYQG